MINAPGGGPRGPSLSRLLGLPQPSAEKLCRPLLLLVPVALLLPHLLPGEATTVFLCTGIAIIPLAIVLGAAARDLLQHVPFRHRSPLASLLGKTAALTLALAALAASELELARGSITGCLMGNLLLLPALASVLPRPSSGPRSERQEGAHPRGEPDLLLLVVGIMVLCVPALSHTAAEPRMELSGAAAAALILLWIISVLWRPRPRSGVEGLREGGSEEGRGRTAPRRSLPLALLIYGSSWLTLAVLACSMADVAAQASQELGLGPLCLGALFLGPVGAMAEQVDPVLRPGRPGDPATTRTALLAGVRGTWPMLLWVAPLMVACTFWLGSQGFAGLVLTEVEVLALYIAGGLALLLLRSPGERLYPRSGPILLLVYALLATALLYSGR